MPMCGSNNKKVTIILTCVRTAINAINCDKGNNHADVCCPHAGPVFSYKLRYIVGFGLVEMAISTNPKPAIYRNLHESTGLAHSAVYATPCKNDLFANCLIEERVLCRRCTLTSRPRAVAWGRPSSPTCPTGRKTRTLSRDEGSELSLRSVTGSWPSVSLTPILFQCWPTVYAGGTTLKQHWVHVSCLLRLSMVFYP